jgi:hypothetical protein
MCTSLILFLKRSIVSALMEAIVCAAGKEKKKSINFSRWLLLNVLLSHTHHSAAKKYQISINLSPSRLVPKSI